MAEIFVLDKKVRLLQPEDGFRTSLDSVMLAAACPAACREIILDLGCGVGGAAFCLMHRVDNLFIKGIDIQAGYIDLARKNIVLNDCGEKCEFVVGDIGMPNILAAEQRFDHVICNPPFLEAGSYTPSVNDGKATALGHQGQDRDLNDWINLAFRALKSGGSLTLIHRADYVDKIIQSLGKRFGQVEIFPLWPHMGEAAKRIVVRAFKDRRSPAIIHAGLILHLKNGDYTPEADRVLRGGEKLF